MFAKVGGTLPVRHPIFGDIGAHYTYFSLLGNSRLFGFPTSVASC